MKSNIRVRRKPVPPLALRVRRIQLLLNDRAATGGVSDWRAIKIELASFKRGDADQPWQWAKAASFVRWFTDWRNTAMPRRCGIWLRVYLAAAECP